MNAKTGQFGPKQPPSLYGIERNGPSRREGAPLREPLGRLHCGAAKSSARISKVTRGLVRDTGRLSIGFARPTR